MQGHVEIAAYIFNERKHFRCCFILKRSCASTVCLYCIRQWYNEYISSSQLRFYKFFAYERDSREVCRLCFSESSSITITNTEVTTATSPFWISFFLNWRSSSTVHSIAKTAHSLVRVSKKCYNSWPSIRSNISWKSSARKQSLSPGREPSPGPLAFFPAREPSPGP